MTSAVIFDLDDTLVDQRAAADAAVVAWAAENGIAGPAAATVDRWHRISTGHYRRFQARELTFQEQCRLRVREFLAVEVDDAGADELFATYLERYESGWTVFDDVFDALGRARGAGWRIAILTNGENAQPQAKVDRLGLRAHVDAVVCSETLPRPSRTGGPSPPHSTRSAPPRPKP